MFGSSKHPTTTPAQAYRRTSDQILLDVREDDEWRAGHAPNAVHVPLARLDPTTLPAAATVLCICRSGGRSSKAVATLRAADITAFNVNGGMSAWADAGLPVITATGEPGSVI